MKRMICLLLTLCLLAACSTAGAESPHFEGKPWINSGFYGLWPSERPAVEESFELYANYDKYQEMLAKGEKREYSPFFDAQMLANRQVASLFTDPDLIGPEAECLRILYGLYMGTEQGQEAFVPLLPYAERLRAAKSLEELNALIREDGWIYGNAFFADTLKTLDPELGKNYIGLHEAPIIDYLPLDEENPEFNRDVEGAKQHLLAMGWNEEEIPQLIDRIVTYVDWLDSWSTVPTTEQEMDLQDRTMFGLVSADDIRGFCTPLYELIRAQGLVREGAEAEPAYRIGFTEMMRFRNLWQEENLETIKAMLAMSMYSAADGILPKDTAAEEDTDPVTAFSYRMPQALKEQGYVRNFIQQERIDLNKELLGEYKNALRARVERNEWASEATKQEVYRKIDKLVGAEILYPYGEIDCTPALEKMRTCDSFIEAYGWSCWYNRQCKAHFAGRDYAPGNRFGHEGGAIGTDYAEGRYDFTTNVFFVGGASLGDITLDMTSRETILGTFGAHLSHEFCHAFDPQCVAYNADFTGSLLVTDEDREIYEQKAAAIAKQVSSIEVFDGVYSNGERQVGEIVADLTGMSLTLDMAKEMDNFDYDAYFRAFAYFFSTYVASREEASVESAYAIHPYPYLRINFAVQHFDEFYQTYPSVTEGTPMYLAPEDRILIW